MVLGSEEEADEEGEPAEAVLWEEEVDKEGVGLPWSGEIWVGILQLLVEGD